MKSRLLKILASVFGLAIFCLAGWVLYRELRAYHLRDILRDLHSLPAARVLLAVLFAGLSYLAATGYDTLGAHYVRHPLPYRRTALAAFIGTTFSNNLGFGLLTGGSLRLRLYSAWGLSVVEISQLLAFATLTLWLGFLALGGVVFSVEPVAVPQALHLPLLTARPVGIVFLAVVAAYLVFTLSVRRPLRVRSLELRLPAPGYVPLQIGVGLLDWSLAAGTLYVLLPPSAGLSFPAFIGIYALALIAGVVSQVPGGLGVFETVFILLLAPRMPASAVLGSLLAYRGIYYLLPLAAAVVLLAGQELARKGKALRAASRAVQRWSSAEVPPLLALATLVGGTVLLVSGATAAVPARMAWLERVLPLPIVETSHFLGSVAGVGLLFLARGLFRRLDAAWLLTAGLLIAGIVFSLLKGADYEEALILAVMLAALLPARRSWVALGLSLLKLGEEARVPLSEFTLEGSARKGLRYTVRKLEAEGAAFEVAPLEAVPALLPELKEISDQWLGHKNTREKSFSLGSFREDYLRRFPAGLVRAGGRIVAFTNLWAGDNREELSIDLMRHLPEAPAGVMEYLFTRLMLWGREQGYRWFNLGMVPLAGLADHALAPWWDRVGTLLFRHGEHFYNFQGLRHFKEKFAPAWSPRYLASPGGLAVPVILTGVAALVSGGLKGVVGK